LSFLFVIIYDFWKVICAMYSLLVVYIGISVGDQIIKRVVVMMSLTG
jgi:hypothetical protein